MDNDLEEGEVLDSENEEGENKVSRSGTGSCVVSDLCYFFVCIQMKST